MTNDGGGNLDEFRFCPTLLKLLETQTVTGETGRTFSEIGALSTPNNLRIIRQIVKRHCLTRSLEVGLALGGSALTILATMAEAAEGGGAHVAIDPFQSTQWDNIGIKLIRDAGFQTRFTLMETPSSAALPELSNRQTTFDLIYVDGSHLFEDVFVDAYFACDLLRPGGFLLFDDCTYPHVAKVIRFLRRNYGDVLSEIDLNQYLTSANLKRRIASWVGKTQLRGFSKGNKARRQLDAAFINF